MLDTTAQVRSMALFAIGNLALAVKERESDNLMIPLSTTRSLCISVYKCLDDKNEKVIGNAIRTIGHLVSILYDQVTPQQAEACAQEMTELCRKVACKLTCKINHAINDATNESTKLTWKQRSNAKRHAWGACNSLKSLFGCSYARKKENQEAFSNALSELIRCVELIQILNEKIVISALSTLTSIPPMTWHYFGGKNVLGNGLAVCINIMYRDNNKESNVKPILIGEIRAMLLSLVNLATEADFYNCFASDDLSASMVEFLYCWMVDQKLEARIYSTVSSVFQRQSDLGDKVEMYIVQKFSSRALHEHKKENQEFTNSSDCIEGEDEL